CEKHNHQKAAVDGSAQHSSTITLNSCLGIRNSKSKMGRKMKASNTSAVQVRPVRAADIPRLCEFVEELLHEWDARTTARDAQRVYERIIKSPELGVILVAESEGNVCGFAYACYEWRSEFGGETMDLVELFVEHSWRKRGVGRTLLEALVEHARS